ncbi:MAG: hypothetical protein WCT54_01335 [Patescibacteria group bacterium]|jgi:hypothetical protein
MEKQKLFKIVGTILFILATTLAVMLVYNQIRSFEEIANLNLKLTDLEAKAVKDQQQLQPRATLPEKNTTEQENKANPLKIKNDVRFDLLQNQLNSLYVQVKIEPDWVEREFYGLEIMDVKLPPFPQIAQETNIGLELAYQDSLDVPSRGIASMKIDYQEVAATTTSDCLSNAVQNKINSYIYCEVKGIEGGMESVSNTDYFEIIRNTNGRKMHYTFYFISGTLERYCEEKGTCEGNQLVQQYFEQNIQKIMQSVRFAPYPPQE